jgi:oligopeptide/dipeptide ABC transporter ATP-binding protein
MYKGKIVEIGPTESVLHDPKHPYTKALLSAVPVPDPLHQRKPVKIQGRVTKSINPAPRCRFYERCPLADHYCKTHDHPPLERRGPDQYSACYHWEQV